jgi:restriction endonuclease Mrr
MKGLHVAVSARKAVLNYGEYSRLANLIGVSRYQLRRYIVSNGTVKPKVSADTLKKMQKILTSIQKTL